MLPQDLLFKAQDGVPGSVVRLGVHLQPSSHCFYHCKLAALALVDLWECDVINLPSLPIFVFQPLSITEALPIPNQAVMI